LKEYIIKGFTLDDERLKQGGQKARYFQELLRRVRDIRSSGRNFYQKVTDIYTTSIDYRKDEKITKEFFLKLSERKLLANAGTVSAQQAALKAEEEFNEYRKRQGRDYISDFDQAVKELNQKPSKRGKKLSSRS